MDLWFADSEVFAHDYLWVFKRQSDGRIEAFWNDCDGVEDFIYREKPVLCGFNFRDYDSYILKATLLGWEPERIHEVSWGCITFDDRNMVWSMFQGEPWVELPPIIDLFHDIVPRKGLKEIEGNIGLSIEESTVSFDIDRPLTSEEQDEVLAYCIHDVNATEKLYDLRYDYVKSKSDLCELQGIDPLTMLKHTNARIVSEVLRAEKLPYDAVHGTIEHYEVPDNVDRTAIPPEVLTYVEGVNTRNCEGEYGEIEFMFHGCPTKVALGGIHAAIPKYMETETDDRVILLQDIGSYYPSLIINNGYMSRAVADPSVYKQFYDMRMEAKAKGDKATADAAKLVLNTTFGVMKDWYNKMYDPMQGTRVCLSGQLYIIDLIEQLFRAVPEGLQLIQLNTDGWVISCPRDRQAALLFAVVAWQERTGFTVDTTFVQRIVQANVNNYVLRTTDGKIKTKGGVVARYYGGDFKSNSMTIIDKAVVDCVLDGVPIEQTINECDDPERFQIIAKAGQTFQKVVHQRLTNHGEQIAIGRRKPKPIITATESDVQRVNRVYATADKSYGGIYKVKLDDGVEVGRSRIPLTPDHCIIDNKNELRQMLTTLDKGWYIDLAHRKVKEFTTRTREEKEQMAETKEPHNELDGGDATKSTPTRKAAAKKSGESTVPFIQKLLALQVAMSGASTGVTFDGVVSNISYEYADTQQYKAWLNEKCSAIGLIFKLDMSCSFPEAFNTKNGVSFGSMASGTVTLIDADTNEREVYEICGFGINVQAGYCVGAAETNALRNFILNNFLLDNKGREGDDVASATDLGGGKFGGGYVSPEEKTQMKQGIADAKGEENKFATDIFANALYPKLMEAREVEGYKTKFSKLLAKHFNMDGTPNGTPIPKKDAVAAMNLAEEIIAEGADA